VPTVLPCNPCPHLSACCSWGVTVLADEVPAIRAAHGDDTVFWDAAEGEHRTRVVNGVCVFKRGNACAIHDEPYYPRVCRGFPWTDGEHGGPYPYDLTICPELVGSTS
jgi:hypothetical protein